MKKIASLVLMCLMLVGCCGPDLACQRMSSSVSVHYTPVFVVTAFILVVILLAIIDDNRDPPASA